MGRQAGRGGRWVGRQEGRLVGRNEGRKKGRQRLANLDRERLALVGVVLHLLRTTCGCASETGESGRDRREREKEKKQAREAIARQAPPALRRRRSGGGDRTVGGGERVDHRALHHREGLGHRLRVDRMPEKRAVVSLADPQVQKTQKSARPQKGGSAQSLALRMGPQGAQTAAEGTRHALAEIESAVAVEVDALEKHLKLVMVHEANER